MGKSACQCLVVERGIPVVDTDLLARRIVEPGQAALGEVVARFGAEILDDSGRLKRHELAARVFSDSVARKDLESILHPRIRSLWRDQVRSWRSTGHPLAVVVIPLLFETQAEKELDKTVCLGCSARTQRERLLARGWTLDQIRQRLESQWPVERKVALADFVIWTEGGMDVHAVQLDRVLASLRK